MNFGNGGDQVSFIVGHGNSVSIRKYAETDFPDNAIEVISELQKRFSPIGPPLIISRQELDLWLKRI